MNLHDYDNYVKGIINRKDAKYEEEFHREDAEIIQCKNKNPVSLPRKE